MRNIILSVICLTSIAFDTAANSVKENDNKTYVIGDEINSIGTLNLKMLGENKIDLTFNIDELPYTGIVNLCSDIETFSNLKSVIKDKDNNIIEKIFEDTSNECFSEFSVMEFMDDQVFIKIDMKSVTGFTSSNIIGHVNQYPIIRSYVTRTFLTKNIPTTLSTRYEHGDLVEMVTADFTYK